MASGITSEWEDAHVKLGNYEERVKETPQSEIMKKEIEKAEQIDPLSNKTTEELKELEDDYEDDFLSQYMEKRKKELQEESKKPQFGSVLEISKETYIREVNNAPEDVIVVVHLYQDYNQNSVKINELLNYIAKKYPSNKFVRSIATKCVENFPDARVPAFIIYKNGQLIRNLINVDYYIKPLNTDSLTRYLKFMDVLPLENGEEKADIEKYSKFILKKSPNKSKDLSDSDEDDREYSTNSFKRY